MFKRLRYKLPPVDKYACPFCGRVFNRRARLKNHNNSYCTVYESIL